jgi:DNA-directed RNA polymerase subunit M/transcription elongation factor TFIIS
MASAVNLLTVEESMDCPKCKGMMLLERFSDFFLIFYAWKCLNCGAIIDRTISNNRQKSRAARESQTAGMR